MARTIFLTAALVVFFMAAPASAQMMCGDRSKIVRHLADTYRETRSGIGMTEGGAESMVVELFTADSGTWTLIITGPPTRTCVIGSGVGWQAITVPLPAGRGS